MPLFEYECRACGSQFEHLTRSGETPACPSCDSEDLQKRLSVFAVGGNGADRSDRRRIIITTQTLSMIMPLVLAALTFTGRVRVWHVFTLAACLGVVNAFDIPARQAFLVEMVGREDLINAIALNSSMVNGARVVGPAIAGLLVAAVGEGWCFLLNGVSYIAVIIGLFMMAVPPRKHVPT